MLRRTLRRITDEQSGFTLIEQLVATVIFLLVMGAVLGLLEASNRTAPRDAERANSITEVQTGLHRMIRELRQAESITSLQAGAIEARVRLPLDDPTTGGTVETHSTWDVRYSCENDSNPDVTGHCIRSAAPTGNTLSGSEQVISRVQNWPSSTPATRQIFTLGQGTILSPQYIRVRIEVPAKGGAKAGHRGNVILQDGFAPRNI